MTTPKEALEAVLSFLDELAANAAPGKRQALNPITIGGSAKLYADGLRASLQGEDAVERVAGCICQNQHRRGYCTEPGCPYSMSDAVEKVKALAHRFWSIHPSTIAAMNLTREEFYVREMMALLATGVVPDESAIRADEREKVKDLACESLLVMSDGYLNDPADDNVRIALSNAAVFMFGKERAQRIRSAIRSNRREA